MRAEDNNTGLLMLPSKFYVQQNTVLFLYLVKATLNKLLKGCHIPLVSFTLYSQIQCHTKPPRRRL